MKDRKIKSAKIKVKNFFSFSVSILHTVIKYRKEDRPMKGKTKEELQQEINQLYFENWELKNTVAVLEEKLKNMQVTLSLEEVIAGCKQLNEVDNAKAAFSPFAELFGNANNNGSDSDGLSDEKMIPDAFPDVDEISDDEADIDY